jgi:thymidine phosphorylase
MFLAQEIIRIKRDGGELSAEHIHAFVDGLVDGSWSEGQAAALSMAIFQRSMSAAETIELTRAMTQSGAVMQWEQANLPGPILDKHSTGGVGDKVSLMLAPIVAACGGFVPMISGRGLGHTGGTLDKFDCIPGYQSLPNFERLTATLRAAGCAIMGATSALAPADKRLYAIRDVTATVESIPLITASILSKKLAAGLQGLVLDVKTGNGAFAASSAMARALAQSLVTVAQGAGLTTRARITDMNQVLGDACGNALEMQEAVAFLQGKRTEQRLLEVTRELSAELLCIGKLAPTHVHALAMVDAALQSGRALERFGRMVALLGGPADFVESMDTYLPKAPVVMPVQARRSGWIAGMDTRAIGLAVITLGGGRRMASDLIDPRVGFQHVSPVGRQLHVGDLLATVHAANENAGAVAAEAYHHAMQWSDASVNSGPVMLGNLDELIDLPQKNVRTLHPAGPGSGALPKYPQNLP